MTHKGQKNMEAWKQSFRYSWEGTCINFGKISEIVCHDSHFSKRQKRSFTCVSCDIFQKNRRKTRGGGSVWEVYLKKFTKIEVSIFLKFFQNGNERSTIAMLKLVSLYLIFRRAFSYVYHGACIRKL